MATSFFPSVKLTNLLEIEFRLNYNFSTFNNYSKLDYFELVWHYERLVEQRKKENEAEEKHNGRVSLRDMAPNMFNQEK